MSEHTQTSFPSFRCALFSLAPFSSPRHASWCPETWRPVLCRGSVRGSLSQAPACGAGPLLELGNFTPCCTCDPRVTRIFLLCEVCLDGEFQRAGMRALGETCISRAGYRRVSLPRAGTALTHPLCPNGGAVGSPWTSLHSFRSEGGPLRRMNSHLVLYVVCSHVFFVHVSVFHWTWVISPHFIKTLHFLGCLVLPSSICCS